MARHPAQVLNHLEGRPCCRGIPLYFVAIITSGHDTRRPVTRNPRTLIPLALTTTSTNNMPSRPSKPPRCQHKSSLSCALCRREKNDLQQVGAWARESSATMAGARSESTDYASFVQDSSYPSYCLPGRPPISHCPSLSNTSQPRSAPHPRSPQHSRSNSVTIHTNRRSNNNNNNNESNLTIHLHRSPFPAQNHQAAASPQPAPTAPSPTVQSHSQSRPQSPRHALSQSTTQTPLNSRRLQLRPNRLLLKDLGTASCRVSWCRALQVLLPLRLRL